MPKVNIYVNVKLLKIKINLNWFHIKVPRISYKKINEI